MFASGSKKTALTLFCYVALILAVASVAQADHHVARDHVVLNRMIKKRIPVLDIDRRSPEPIPVPALGTVGAGSTPPVLGGTSDENAGAASSSSSEAPSTATSATPTSATSATSTAQSSESVHTSSASSSASSSTSASQLTSASSSSSASSSASTSSSVSTSTSESSTSESSTPVPSAAPVQETQNNNDVHMTTLATETTAAPKSTTRITATITDNSAQSTSGAVATGAAASVSKTAITVVFVIAGSIGAVVVGWTVIRKWKFKPSSSFEDRMNPIDWQPTTSDDTGVPGGLRRTASAASHGSFHSGSGHGEDVFARHGSDHGHAPGTTSLQPIPDHDFTAGAASLAPVGGYADLARGPSPQPQMAELNRGPSMNRGYDTYGVPLHHAAYDYNSAPRY